METVIHSVRDVWGHPSSLSSSGEPRLSQNNISVATCSDAQRERQVPPAPRDTDVSSDPGKQSGKTPKYQPRGSLGSKGNSTERRGSKKQSHHPSAANKRGQCQHRLGPAAATTSSRPGSASPVLRSTPASPRSLGRHGGQALRRCLRGLLTHAALLSIGNSNTAGSLSRLVKPGGLVTT